MEHESFVPGTTTARLVRALRTPEVVRASLPGWQPDTEESSGGGAGAARPAGDAEVGRLRLRIGGSTITYRATVTVDGAGPGFTVTAVGTEVRGGARVTAKAEVSLVTAVRPESGVTVVWRGEAEAEGRLAAYEPAVVEAAVRRLFDRFCAELAVNAPAALGTADDVPPAGAGAGAGSAADGGAETGGRPVAVPAESEDADSEDADGTGEGDDGDGPAEGKAAGEASDTEPDAEPDHEPEPEPEPEPDQEPEAEAEPEADVVDDLGEPGTPADPDDFELVEVEVEVPESAAALDDLVPPAEAAHARRTMIGRSAEEVDHAPPRGRYAPVPAPDSSSAAATLRWAAPVAAALVASAVVVGRVLRRRG